MIKQIVILVIFSICQSLACKCSHRNDSELYCSSDFVAHIEVKDSKVSNETSGKSKFEVFEYQVTFETVYKKSKRFAEAESKKLIYSNAMHAGCGMELNISKDAKKNHYLVAGYVHKDKAYIHRCGWVKNWDEVSESVKQGLDKKVYESDCPEKVIQKDNEARRLMRKKIFNETLETEHHNKNNTEKRKPRSILSFLF